MSPEYACKFLSIFVLWVQIFRKLKCLALLTRDPPRAFNFLLSGATQLRITCTSCFLFIVSITLMKMTFFFTEFNYSMSLKPKLLGGVQALSGYGKYMASFLHGNLHLCSAFLISNKHVLIAAHCLRDFLINKTIPNFKEYCVVVGLYDWNIGGICHLIEEVQVLSSYNHSIHNPSQDVGLITVDY